MKLKFKIALLLAMLINVCMYGQDSYTVSGVVTSTPDNSPLPGVTVRVVNTNRGSETDFDGKYSIQVKKGDVLEFSYLGYATQNITINSQKSLNVSMSEDASVLDEIVVVGYGTQKKSHLTGAISKVKNEKLDQIAVARVDDALVGQVSGVNIQATEGEAGSAPTIRIRGVGSISGSVSPLIVVDGLVVDNDYLSALDMNDVDSFEVLKDAASTAIYGSRGSKGVIMITTKQGKEGKPKFSYSTFTGFKTARQSDAYYFTVAETAAAELAATGSISDKTAYKQLIGVDNNWQNIIFDGGVITNHSFSARGGSKNTRFSAAVNYLHDEGVLLTDDFKKYNVKLKVDTKINDKLSFGVSVTPSFTDRRRFDGSTHDILRQPSWLPLYLDENTIQFVNRTRDGGKYADAQIGDYAIQRMFDDFDLATGMPVPGGGSGLDISNTSNTNPAAKVLERDRTDEKFKIFGNVYAKYQFTDNLSFRTSVGGDFQNTKYRRWQGVLSNRNGASAASLELANTNRLHLVTESYFTYENTIEKHEISAVLGTGSESWNTKYNYSRGAGFTSDLLQTMSAADPLTVTANSQGYETRIQSYFGRLNYAFDDGKYLASLSVRADGHSAFGENNKYGYFPAASVGWSIHKEDFLEDVEKINNLKLRISYGITGNPQIDTGDNQIDSYPYLALLGTTNAVIDGATVTGLNPLNIANPDLKWESSVEFNPGIDFGLFNNIISGSFDYYKRTSKDLLIDNPISTTTGFSSALVNIGEVENTGFELELRTRNISVENFKWSSTLIASKNENTLTDFADSNGQIQSVDSKRAAEWINLEGNPISSFYGWVVDREIPLEYISNPWHPIGAQAQDVYVRDLNGDGVIDDDDKTILGSPYPDIVWSLSNEFKIKDFDVSFMFQGSHGAEVRNMGDQYIFNQFNSAQDFISTTPDQEFIKQKIFTNSIIQDASYIALRNVNIGYNFTDDLLSKVGFTRGRVYLSGQNLLYLTADNYTGFNPESINDTSSTTYGYQRAGSPVFSTISLGVNVEF
ncbi:MAG: SusC/RagA family TonB-linked outer membrane protein [Polaribacter sp.]